MGRRRADDCHESTGGVEKLLEAPTSVVAFDGDALASIGAQNVGDIADFTPNLEITLSLCPPRTLSSSSAASDSKTATLMPRAPWPSSSTGSTWPLLPAQLSQLFDVEGLTVLPRAPRCASRAQCIRRRNSHQVETPRTRELGSSKFHLRTLRSNRR